MPMPLKIISGGQTGVDQAALKAALACGLAIGGWCPPGRVCESGIIPPEYPLKETEKECSERAPEIPRSLRTERNVKDSEGVLVLLPMDMSPDPGTQWTLECAAFFRKPFQMADPFSETAVEIITEWIKCHKVSVLNVAGPAESRFPGIFSQTHSLLVKVFSGLKEV